MSRVLVIQNSIKTTLIFRKNYILGLLAKGYSVDILAPIDCVESKLELELIGANVLTKKNQSSLVFLLFANYYLLFKSKVYSLLICHFISTFILISLSLPFLSVKKVVVVEGLGSIASNNRIIQKFCKLMLHFVDVRIFCNSDEVKLIGKSEDFVMGGIGVDIEKFQRPSLYHEKKEKVFRLLYVGRLIADKGIKVAIQAFGRLIEEGYEVKLTIIGEVYPTNPSSLTDSEISEYSRQYGDRIRFLGYLTNIEEHYYSSDILLLPSKREGFPVCVMEASAAGVPSVCFDVPGCRDAISMGHNGVLVSEFSLNAYVKGIVSILNDERLEALRVTSENYARSNFDSSIKTREFLSYVL